MSRGLLRGAHPMERHSSSCASQPAQSHGDSQVVDVGKKGE